MVTWVVLNEVIEATCFHRCQMAVSKQVLFPALSVLLLGPSRKYRGCLPGGRTLGSWRLEEIQAVALIFAKSRNLTPCSDLLGSLPCGLWGS